MFVRYVVSAVLIQSRVGTGASCAKAAPVKDKANARIIQAVFKRLFPVELPNARLVRP